MTGLCQAVGFRRFLQVRHSAARRCRANHERFAVARGTRSTGARSAASMPAARMRVSAVVRARTDHWLGDGFHRLLRPQEGGARVDRRRDPRRDAARRDPLRLRRQCEHGLRRTNADKRKAVSIMLGDEGWSQLSDRDIARRCGVSDQFLSKIRHEGETPAKPGVSTDDRSAKPSKRTNAKSAAKQKKEAERAALASAPRTSGRRFPRGLRRRSVRRTWYTAEGLPAPSGLTT